MLTMKKNIFFSSVKRYLSDSSIAFTLLAILSLDASISNAVRSNYNITLLLSALVMMLSYNIGLTINALSYFLFSNRISKREEKIYLEKNWLVSWAAEHTTERWDFARIKEYYAINSSIDYFKVSYIVHEYDSFFEKIGKNFSYVPGLKQYIRNWAFVLLPLTLFMSRRLLYTGNLQWYALIQLASIFAIFIMINFCALINYYQNTYTIFLADTLCRTSSPNFLSLAQIL